MAKNLNEKKFEEQENKIVVAQTRKSTRSSGKNCSEMCVTFAGGRYLPADSGGELRVRISDIGRGSSSDARHIPSDRCGPDPVYVGVR